MLLVLKFHNTFHVQYGDFCRSWVGLLSESGKPATVNIGSLQRRVHGRVYIVEAEPDRQLLRSSATRRHQDHICWWLRRSGCCSFFFGGVVLFVYRVFWKFFAGI